MGETSDTSRRGLPASERAALVVSGLWLALCAVFWLLTPGGGALGGFGAAVVVSALFVPIALIWIAAAAARASGALRRDSERLREASDRLMQAAPVRAEPASPAPAPLPSDLIARIDAIAAAQSRIERAVADLRADLAEAAAPAPETAPAPEPTQPDLALHDDGDAPLAAGLTADDFIVALNFPETADDRAGFDALRRALADPRASRLVRAAQDMLTLLSQDGIYMDDLAPDRARPEVWRRFADGERGRTVADLGGLRDEAALEKTRARLRADPIFRDTGHHFVRTFDQVISSWTDEASDAEIVAFSDTRTARAFMLVARVVGLFD